MKNIIIYLTDLLVQRPKNKNEYLVKTSKQVTRGQSEEAGRERSVPSALFWGKQGELRQWTSVTERGVVALKSCKMALNHEEL